MAVLITEGEVSSIQARNLLKQDTFAINYFNKNDRTLSALHTFRIIYGSKGNFELKYSRIKKGSGKGKLVYKKITVKSNNSIDNLTWCV